jgi:pyruvate dehydrogenase E2 component (dihydrolipoamide acetyltransferase)
MADVNMPKLSDTMEEGTVLGWRKQDGDEVKKGEVIAEIESDKASFEIEAESDGVLHIVVGEGQAVPVGQQIGSIGGEAPAKQKPAEAEPQARQDKPEQKEGEREAEPEPKPRAKPKAATEEESDKEPKGEAPETPDRAPAEKPAPR